MEQTIFSIGKRDCKQGMIVLTLHNGTDFKEYFAAGKPIVNYQ